MADKGKGKHSAKDIRAAEEEAHAEAIRDIFRNVGQALAFTIMFAQHPAGGPQEDELLAACDDAWSSLADKVIDFAKEN